MATAVKNVRPYGQQSDEDIRKLISEIRFVAQVVHFDSQAIMQITLMNLGEALGWATETYKDALHQLAVENLFESLT